MKGTWLDLVIVLIVVLSITLETKRGFGKAIFDFFAFLLALRITDMLYVEVAQRITFSSNPQMNNTWSYGILLVVLGIIFWFLGKLAYESTQISLDTFDPALGAVLGFGIALILGHAFVTIVYYASKDATGASALLQNSMFAQEFYTFSGYHSFIDTLKRMGE